MRRLHPILPVLALLLLFTSNADIVAAQQGTASLRGRATDEQGAVLPGVTVVVTHQETGASRETQTGADGAYSVPNLIAGSYRVSAEIEGFSRLTRDNLVLLAGATQTLELEL